MPYTYPLEFKIKAIRRYEKGESIQSLCQELHIAQSTLYHWRKQFCSITTPQRSYTPKEFDAISRQLQKLEHMIDVIRLSGFIPAVPLQKRLATLEHLYHQPDNPFSVHELCDALGVARGTFYNHIFRRADRSKYQEEQKQLELKVKQVFDDNDQRFGASKIRMILAESGIRVSAKRVSAIMQELDLHSVRTDAKKLYKAKQQRQKQNLLERVFTASRPNQIWVSDLTYFKVKSYWVYLCVILDLYSRKVIGYKVSRHMSTRLATLTFRQTFEERGRPDNLTFHSDRGSQYISKTFSELLQRCGAKQSFSASGRPLDNAVAEAFFSSFKREETYRREYTSEKHFCRCVAEYITFYNEVRPHLTLRYQTPQAFEEAYYLSYIKKSCSTDSEP